VENTLKRLLNPCVKTIFFYLKFNNGPYNFFLKRPDYYKRKLPFFSFDQLIELLKITNKIENALSVLTIIKLQAVL
jgi:hypothetical protein